jgi:hypothetical protein
MKIIFFYNHTVKKLIKVHYFFYSFNFVFRVIKECFGAKNKFIAFHVRLF